MEWAEELWVGERVGLQIRALGVKRARVLGMRLVGDLKLL